MPLSTPFTRTGATGTVVKVTFGLPPSDWPRPAVKFAVAPADRARVPNVSVAVWPAPAVTFTVEFPDARLRPVVEVWLDAAALLPSRLRVPPFRVTPPAAAGLIRVAVFVAVLSSTTVPPVLTVSPVIVPRVPAPARVSCPPFTVTVLLRVSTPDRTRLPVGVRVTVCDRVLLTVGTGVLD